MPRSFSLYINSCHGNGRKGSIVSQRVTILYSEFAVLNVHSKCLLGYTQFKHIIVIQTSTVT